MWGPTHPLQCLHSIFVDHRFTPFCLSQALANQNHHYINNTPQVTILPSRWRIPVHQWTGLAFNFQTNLAQSNRPNGSPNVRFQKLNPIRSCCCSNTNKGPTNKTLSNWVKWLIQWDRATSAAKDLGVSKSGILEPQVAHVAAAADFVTLKAYSDIMVCKTW